ncbi:DNA internalization-related competence protein ComEC/Rec2 [Pseudomonas sp. LRF_L74]|uniref:DNA internalization-related competence protein ComEC/Rec2 n=1 Tax=Pseudomonas sp. LRF_L74 TaxID=3369422 RepID=UPI003F5FDBD6
MRTGMLALALGLACLPLLPALLPAWALILLLVLAVCCLPFRTYPIAFFLVSLCWASVSAQWALDDRLIARLDGQTLWIEGEVVGLPDVSEQVLRFQLQDAVSRRYSLPRRMRLSWHGGPPILAGERWRLAVKLKRPRGLVNPQGFDYEAWLTAQRIGATGTVKAGERVREAGGLASWRDALRQRMLAVEAHGRAGGLAALVLGDASGLTTADWRVLQDTGTVHLMVISGQHVTLFSALLYGLIAGLARLGAWPSRLPWLPCACVMAFTGALGYGLMAGFEVPVRRSCVMIAVVLLWRLRFRHLGVGMPLLMAWNLVLLAEPLATLQAGFWLSFGAVAILALVFSARLGVSPWWDIWWRAQWTVTIGLLPPFLLLGLPISLTGPLTNLVAVPWVSFLVVPLALLGAMLLPVPWLGEGMLWLAGLLLDWLLRGLGWAAALYPAWLPMSLPLWAWCLISLGCLLALLPPGVPVRLLSLPLLALLFFTPQQLPVPGRADVWQFDVGQGLSLLVRTQNHALLYDAGPRTGDFDIGERVVVPSLRALGVSRLDVLLLSHADSDHAGGAPAVQTGLAVERVLSGEVARLPGSLGAETCRDDESWTWDGVRFTTWHWAEGGSGNALSCVLRVEANGESILLTGDIDVQAEAVLLARGRQVRADWLQVPHHGSRSSSSVRFLNQATPGAALISRGQHNAFGHPHPRVVARYRSRGIELYDSVVHGAILIRLGEHRLARGLRQPDRFWREK